MELYLDLSKALLNRGRLVRRAVQVHGQNGKMFTRMQWVDPRSGQPVMENHGGKHDHEKNAIENLSPGDKGRLAHRYLDRDHDRSRLFVKHTGGNYRAPIEELTNHVAHNLTDVPIDHLKPHMEGLGQDKPPSIGIQHTDHGLTTPELNKRLGNDGPLNLGELTKGTLPYKDSYHKGTGWTREDKREYHRVFGDTTVEGLERIFSHPDGEFKAILQTFNLVQEPLTGDKQWVMNMSLHDKDGYEQYKALTKNTPRHRIDEGKYKIGDIFRTVTMDDDGKLHVDNEEFTLNEEHHGKGYADHIYDQSEQYWKHISKGHPIKITLTANISVGCYAWAKKGFDFKDNTQLESAHRAFRDFCKRQGILAQDVARDNGFEKLSQIKHSWEFASLKYKGDKYDLKSLVHPDYKDEVRGTAHFGKAFMMGGLESWKGIKTLNDNTLDEKVGDIHARYRK